MNKGRSFYSSNIILPKEKIHTPQGILDKSRLTEADFTALLWNNDKAVLENMAEKAMELTRRYFGWSIQYYLPVYVSNQCINLCSYCGFNHKSSIKREDMSFEQLHKEARAIKAKGIDTVLILSGEPGKTMGNLPRETYLLKAVEILRTYFSTVNLEIFSCREEQYKAFVEAGVYGLTLYQETYNPELYKKYHLKGPKADYNRRLEAVEEACRGGIKSLSLGVLLGLGPWREDALALFRHISHIQKKYPQVDISVSVPRLRPISGTPPYPVSDADMLRLITAFRIAFPHLGINLSTREDSLFRDHVLPLGITTISVESVTTVGGYTEKKSGGQFEIADHRPIEEVTQKLNELGFQPVYKDWEVIHE